MEISRSSFPFHARNQGSSLFEDRGQLLEYCFNMVLLVLIWSTRENHLVHWLSFVNSTREKLLSVLSNKNVRKGLGKMEEEYFTYSFVRIPKLKKQKWNLLLISTFFLGLNRHHLWSNTDDSVLRRFPARPELPVTISQASFCREKGRES